jgi:hypothetical protein
MIKAFYDKTKFMIKQKFMISRRCWVINIISAAESGKSLA